MSAEGSRFGPYELIRRLGAGGMAETFVAVRRGPGDFEQRVCLKRILPAFEEDAEFVRLFLEEARIAATLRHANVVQVVDFGVADGSHFMALELIDGLDLRALLSALRARGETMTSGLVSHLAYELAAALEYAHEADAAGTVRGIVHRDISPSNVLLSTAGEVKLADFGIAKAMNKTHVTRSGGVKGKVPYMAPEYALSGHSSARSDLFSLGVTLYECLAGVRPFDGRTELDTMRRVQEGVHEALHDRKPSAPRMLTSAIERLIEAAPEARFPNARALEDALVDVAPPPTARRILGELVRRVAREREETAAKRSTDVAYADTAAGTPGGTLLLDAEDAVDGHVVPASPNAETRTANSLGSASPETATATVADAGVEAARSVADEETRALEPKAHVPAEALPSASPTPPGPRRRAPLLAMAIAVGGAVAVVGVLLATRAPASGDGEAISDAPPSTAEATAHERAPAGDDANAQPHAAPSSSAEAARPEELIPSGVDLPPVETPTDPADTETGDLMAEAASPRAARPEGPGTLHIGVLPWGEVFVDGRSRGPAPVQVEVRPGAHRVRVVGPGGLEEEQRVRVVAGRAKQVQIRLR